MKPAISKVILPNRHKIHLTCTQYRHNAVSWSSSPTLYGIHQRVRGIVSISDTRLALHISFSEGEEKREKERKREEENDYSIEECSIKRTKRLRRCRYRIISFRAMIRKNLLEESHFEGGGGHGRGSRHISSDTPAITTATTTAWKKGETRLSRAQCLSILLEPP